jgi:hypothetical protein
VVFLLTDFSYFRIGAYPAAIGKAIDVLPAGHVSAIAQDASACLCLASAVLSMVLSLDASEAELELLPAVFVFGLTLVFVIVWLGSTFRVIGNFVSLSLLVIWKNKNIAFSSGLSCIVV